ncbi:glycosyltransferase family 2 protein [Bacteroides hominis]|jgi:GT2 family glycosyltransferase|uniref:glycosyltransferase family 2 protein n=1 Tax=Bacteroides hominis TaxID=2763023 RepID=UPI003D6D9880
MESKVGTVIVTYNRLTLLKEAVEALRQQTYLNQQIIIVNNGSTDSTAEWLQKQKDIVIINQENLGGAGGFFTGMKYVAEHNFDFCWIMDDDVICQPNALEELIYAYYRKKNIGFVCSKVVGTNGNPMNVPTINTYSKDGNYPNFTDLIEFQMIKVSEATFVSLFLSTKIIFEAGLPYKEFFIWGDDTEYTTRISKKYDCYMACKSIVLHKRLIQKAISFENETDSGRLKMHYYANRNLGFIGIKHYNKRRIKIILGFIKCSIKHLLHGHTKQFYIMLQASKNLISFNPKIKFPQNNKSIIHS